jgi:predicted MFS family arabinose efflux permease
LAIVFGGLYSACCLIKLSSSFTILMVGRILGGISTSLLFSVFESWMVSEHHKVRAESKTGELKTFVENHLPAFTERI